MDTPSILLYASEVGAAAGLNRWNPPHTVMESLWRRYDNRTHYEQAVEAAVGIDTRSSKVRLADSVRVIDPTLLKDAAKLGANAKNAKELQEVFVLLNQRNTELCLSVEQSDLVRGHASCEFGTKQEATVVQSHKISNNNGRFRHVPMGRVGTSTAPYPWSLGGRCDGFRDGKLVEIKHRRQRFMLPPSDRAQICAYMYIYDVPSATLIETLGDVHKETRILRSDSFFVTDVIPPLGRFLNKYVHLLESRAMQQRFLHSPEETYATL